MELLNKIFRFISIILSPLMIPTYAVAIALSTSYLNSSELSVRVTVTLTTLLITGVAPMLIIYGLWRMGQLSDTNVTRRAERLIPYIVGIIAYICCAFYLAKANAPSWLYCFMVGGAFAILTSLVVNLRWKISAHAAGMGGLLALCLYLQGSGIAITNMMWPTIIVAILAGLIGTARVILERHTLLQVAAGFLNGFVWIMLFA